MNPQWILFWFVIMVVFLFSVNPAVQGIHALVRKKGWAELAKAWGGLAGRTGLTLEPGLWLRGVPPRLTGAYRGHSLTLETFSLSGGWDENLSTRIVIIVPNQANTYLAIYDEPLFGWIGKSFGAEDVQLGDEEVDRRFMIKSRPASLAAALFTSVNFRSKLLQARSVNIEVDGRELHFERRGVEKDTDYLVFLVDMLSDLADLVERPQEAASPPN